MREEDFAQLDKEANRAGGLSEIIGTVYMNRFADEKLQDLLYEYLVGVTVNAKNLKERYKNLTSYVALERKRLGLAPTKTAAALYI